MCGVSLPHVCVVRHSKTVTKNSDYGKEKVKTEHFQVDERIGVCSVIFICFVLFFFFSLKSAIFGDLPQ